MTQAFQHQQLTGGDERAAAVPFMNQIRIITWKMLRMESHNLGPYGLTRQQAFVLSAIGEFGPDIDMATLASLTGFPPSTITSILDRFHELRLVSRGRDEHDRRRVTATITDEGRALDARIEAGKTRALQALLDGISDEDIDTVTRVFRHMTERLDHVDVAAVSRSQSG
jgi:MarR family transcriptional repressor of emrRAB